MKIAPNCFSQVVKISPGEIPIFSAAADAQVADGDDVEVWEDLGSPGPLVCFLSERRGPGDVLSTLIQISPITFALPPISTIRLVADHPANGWQLGDHTMTRRCLCVTARVVY